MCIPTVNKTKGITYIEAGYRLARSLLCLERRKEYLFSSIRLKMETNTNDIIKILNE